MSPQKMLGAPRSPVRDECFRLNPGSLHRLGHSNATGYQSAVSSVRIDTENLFGHWNFARLGMLQSVFGRLLPILIIIRSNKGKIWNSRDRVVQIRSVKSDDRNPLADRLAQDTIQG